jgi:glycine cleavage system H protein
MIASVRQPLLRSVSRHFAQRTFIPAARSFASSASQFKVQTRYTSEHEWVRFDDATGMGTIGITDYAQKSLGDVVFVELPSEGSEVKQGGEYLPL